MTYVRFHGAWYSGEVEEVEAPLSEMVPDMLQNDFGMVFDEGEGSERLVLLNDPCGTGQVYVTENLARLPPRPQLIVTYG